MTLLDFEELVAYWSEHPPVHLLAAAYLSGGLTKKRQFRPSLGGPGASAAATGSPDFASLLAELGPGFGAGDVHAGLKRVVLDFSELKRRAGSAQ